MKRLILLGVMAFVVACSMDRSPTDPMDAAHARHGTAALTGGNVSPDYMQRIVETCTDTWGWSCSGDYGLGSPWDEPIYSACTEDPTSCEFLGGGEAMANPVDVMPEPTLYDAVDIAAPNCNNPQTQMEQLWCTGRVPSPGERSLIASALQRMSNKSGTCAVMAAVGQALLNNNMIHLFARNTYTPDFGGGASMNQGSAGWMLLSDYWPDVAFDMRHPAIQTDAQNVTHTRTLQQVLAHEIDHLRGQSHTDYYGYDTPNSQACSDAP